MTATATAPMTHHLQLITGLPFETSNIFWPSLIGMQCRSVCIKVRRNASVLNFVHQSIHPLCLSITASKQWLLYGNSRVKIDQYHHKVCAYYLDQHGLIGDIKGMVYSAVGGTPAFMVAAAALIPAFPTCPYFRAGSALERKCYPRGNRYLQLVSIVLFTSVPYYNPAEVSDGWTHFPNPGQTRR